MRLDGGGRGFRVGRVPGCCDNTFLSRFARKVPTEHRPHPQAWRLRLHVRRMFSNDYLTGFSFYFRLGEMLTIGFQEFPFTTPGSFAWASGFFSSSAISRRVSSEDISIVISYPAAGGDNGIAYLGGQDTPRASVTVRPATPRNRLRPLQNHPKKDTYLDTCPKTHPWSPRGP